MISQDRRRSLHYLFISPPKSKRSSSKWGLNPVGSPCRYNSARELLSASEWCLLINESRGYKRGRAPPKASSLLFGLLYSSPLAAKANQGLRLKWMKYRFVKKNRTIGCVISRCKLQCGITQPILRLFLTYL